MARFEDAIEYTLKWEGGFVHDPDDPGGATNKGVTLRVATKWGIETPEDLRNISDELVKKIYKSDYWFHDLFHSQKIATKIFDAGVNMGPKISIKILQKALNSTGVQPILQVDGNLGPLTLNAANTSNESELLDAICDEMEEHYRDIVSIRPASGKFLKGWLRRANSIP